MNTQTTANNNIWLNPAMLSWAREWGGKTIAEAAAKLKKKPEVIEAWENSEGMPTVKQARTLAKFYGRPFLEFFLSEPPVLIEPEFIPDFRTHVGTDLSVKSREIKKIQQWAETQRVNALDLYEEIGEQPEEIASHLFSTLTSKPDDAASQARNAIDFSIQDQIKLKKAGAVDLPKILRNSLEKIGILTLKNSDLKELGVRGICIAAYPLPIIVYQSESPTAQAFTLAHELGHILLRESGITGFQRSDYDKQPIERWCDRFAASFLIPEEQVTAIIGVKPSYPSDRFEDADLKYIADIFSVSPHAMLIRLVHLGYVKEAYYWSIKKPQFDEQESTHRSFGRAPFYGRRYQSSLGNLYTGLVLEAWNTGRITNHNAAEYMGIKNINHLHDIRDRFGR